MSVSRRTFLKFTVAAIASSSALPLSPIAEAPQQEPIRRLFDFWFTPKTSGYYSLVVDGREVIPIPIAAGCPFRWVAAPGGEVVGREFSVDGPDEVDSAYYTWSEGDYFERRYCRMPDGDVVSMEMVS